MFHAWLRLALDTTLLGYESQRVVSLRLARLAAGGAAAEAEAQRMVLERAPPFSRRRRLSPSAARREG